MQSVIKSVRQRGSSPLARGTLRIIKVKANANRLIPARAGNTQSPSPSAAEPTAHPRSRGEHEKARTATAEVTGSSPLARGTRVFANPLGFLERLIPARAGNTAVIFLMISPPRLIPARAGNTPSYRVNRLSPSAHPRSRGEHPLFKTAHATACGSSPLARGTQNRSLAHRQMWRLIPARAGNTLGYCRPRQSRAAHPRSRGEHYRQQLERFNPSGSSPLARGTLQATFQNCGGVRLIPARAGNTNGEKQDVANT